MALSADLQTRLLAHLDDGDTAHDTHHARRVWALCKIIAAGEGIEADDALLAAACLHDLITLPKDHPNRAMASQFSAHAAHPIMAQEGMTSDQINAAAHAIEAHSFSAGIKPQTPQAKVLQDADRIEALGAIGLARVFAVSGTLGRPLWHPDDPFAEARTPDDTDWALDHFEVKLLRLPEWMNTTTGRRIAKERTVRLQRFLNELREELEV